MFWLPLHSSYHNFLNPSICLERFCEIDISAINTLTGVSLLHQATVQSFVMSTVGKVGKNLIQEQQAGTHAQHLVVLIVCSKSE